jgi:carbon storage regulator
LTGINSVVVGKSIGSKGEFMLVLVRKEGDEVLMDGNVIRVLKIDKNHVRIGFEAPTEVRIVRSELVKKEAKKRAKKSSFN